MPLANIDEKQVAKLAFEGASNRDIGVLLGCDDKTVKSRFSAILDKKRAERRQLRRKQQDKLANDGNPAMLIWLGKNELDQTDKQAVEVSGRATIDVLTRAQEIRKQRGGTS